MNEWILFKEQFPDKHRDIIIKHPDDDEEYETRTYIHQGNLMVEFRDGNTFFAGLSPKLFPEGSTWKYKES